MGIESVGSNQILAPNTKPDWVEAVMWGGVGVTALSSIPACAIATGACGFAALAALGSNSRDAPTYLALSMIAGYFTYRCGKANLSVAGKAFQNMSNSL